LFNLTKCKTYHWTFGNPDYVSYWNEKQICIGLDGEGNNAITLESEMEHVGLAECGVFKSPPLADSNNPAISFLEVYKLIQ
jgi:hypothetical protein